MKKVAILPRKYYNTSSINYRAGDTAIVADDEAKSMEKAGIATILEDVKIEVAETPKESNKNQKEETK